MARPTRRDVLWTALASAGLFLPRRAFADAAPERKFLFVFAPGGWDVCDVFAPIFNDTTDHQEGDEAAEVGGFSITDGAGRPAVRSFFERWGARSCVINGLQVPSVAHDVCTRLVMTGTSNDGFDDWASIVAGESLTDRVLPNVHLSGPMFPSRYVEATVRVGLAGQLPRLLDGSALLRSDVVIPPVGAEREALEKAFVRARLDRWAGTAAAGQPARVASAEQLALVRAERLEPVGSELAIGEQSLYGTASVAVRALTSGLARSGLVAFGSGGNGEWDTHSGNDRQNSLYETLFDALERIVDDLDAAPGEVEASLLDETTIVVLSEMGRTPQRNAAGGKDHWTWTSALLIGSGIAGGRTIGAWTERLTGEPVDLASGEAHESGETLVPNHLGATVLTLAGLDPAEFIDPSQGKPIEAALS